LSPLGNYVKTIEQTIHSKQIFTSYNPEGGLKARINLFTGDAKIGHFLMGSSLVLHIRPTEWKEI
jgi:hypothetical protein